MGEPHSLEGCISLGPWGGPGGHRWSTVKGRIKQIVIVSGGGAVDSISFKIINENGEHSRKFGGSGGENTNTVDIDWPNEYLTSIGGTSGSYSGYGVITSLYFYTNLNRHGPFGPGSGTGFDIPLEGGHIVGFHGRVGGFLDAIGTYVRQGPPNKEVRGHSLEK